MKQKQIKLLFIEDNWSLVQDLKMYFECFIPNLEMETANSLETAKTKLKTEYDCIILDGELLDCQGEEVLDIMSEESKKITILHSGNFDFVRNHKSRVFSGHIKGNSERLAEDIKKLTLN